MTACRKPFYVMMFTMLAGVLAWNAMPAWVLIWPALSFLIVAAAYGGAGPGVFGKRTDGTRAGWATVCLFPYLVLLWVIWSLRRLIGREPCCTQIVPGIWLGRRPYEYELPPRTACIVDLACEFIAAKRVTAQRDYISLPTLDTLIPAETDFLAAIKQASAHSGGLYVHCALGHGRSAMFVAAILLERNIAQTPAEAVQMIRKARPAIRLSRRQADFLEQLSQKGAIPCKNSRPVSGAYRTGV